MEIIEDIENHLNESKDYIELVDKLTKEHTQRIDSLIDEATELTKNPDYSIDMSSLQICYINLATELYRMIDKLKQFDIYSSLAEIKEVESFNNAYLTETTIDTGKKPTVKELEIKAENKSKKESLINIVYKSAFKAIRDKINAGNLVVDTLKNIIRLKLNTDFSTNQTNNNKVEGVF